MRRLPRVLLVALLALLVTAACGGGDGDDAQTVGAASAPAADESDAPEATTTTTAPAEIAPTTTVVAEPNPVPLPPVTVVAEPPAQTPPAEQAPAPAAEQAPPAPTTGRVDGTYTASDAGSHTEVVLRVAGGDPVASVQGTGDLPFAFDGVAPGRYVVEASERGPEVADPNGAVTSSATTVRSAPFDLQAGYTWTFACDTNGCGN